MRQFFKKALATIVSVSLTGGMLSLLAVQPASAAASRVGCAPIAESKLSDFSKGSSSGAVFTNVVDGEVTLSSLGGSSFESVGVPHGWTTKVWTQGGAATVDAGVLRLDGVRTGVASSYGSDTALEFSAIFTADANQHAGLAIDYETSTALAFSTRSGGGLAVYNNGVVTPLPATLLNARHLYRIERSGSAVTYLVDGNVVAQHTASAVPLFPMFSDYSAGGKTLELDDVAVVPYSAIGSLTSRVIDVGSVVRWNAASWSASTPAGTSLVFGVRGGDTPTPDLTWTGWREVMASGDEVGIDARYLQYRVGLATQIGSQVPELYSLTLEHAIDESRCGQPTSVIDTESVDFEDGSKAGVVVTANGDGELTLPPGVGSTFSTGVLPSNWSASAWTAGGSASVVSESLRVDGAQAGAVQMLTPGSTLDFDATFSGDANEHAGLAVDYSQANALVFSTRGGGGLWVYHNGALVQLQAGLLGTQHHYTIAWKVGSVDYLVDGQVVAQLPYGLTTPLRPLYSDYDSGRGALVIDNVSMTPYSASGVFTSRVLDAGSTVDWTNVTWSGISPVGTTITVRIRSGNVSIPDATWSAWRPVSSGDQIGSRSRYVQYEVRLGSSSDLVSPTLADIAFNWPAAVPVTSTTTSSTTTSTTTTSTTLIVPAAAHDVIVAVHADDIRYGTESIDVSATLTSEMAVDEGSVLFSISRDGTSVGESILSEVSNGQAIAELSIPSHTSVGTYSIEASFGGTSKFAPARADHSLAVTPAPLRIAVENVTRPYGTDNPLFDPRFEGFVNGDTPASLAGALTLTTAAGRSSHVGTYVVRASGVSSPDYDITFVDGSLAVERVRLSATVKGAVKTYGSENPAFSVELDGFVNGDDETDLQGQLVFDTAASKTSDVGTYIVSASGYTSLDYEISYSSGTFTISKAAVTVKIDDVTTTYGQLAPSYTVTATGLPAGVSLGDLGNLVLSAGVTPSSGVGSYRIEAAGLDVDNFDIEIVGGIHTVLPARLDVRVNDAVKEYGASMPGLAVSYDGFVNGDTASSLKGALKLTTAATASSGVGSYTVEAGGLLSANYSIGFRSGVLVVTPAALQIRADDKSKIVGQANPPLTASYSGFVNGDTAASLKGTLVLSTAATASSPVGSYPIRVSGQGSTNYVISYLEGTLRVTAAGACSVPGALSDEARLKASPRGKAIPFQFDCRGDLARLLFTSWTLQRIELDCKTYAAIAAPENVLKYRPSIWSGLLGLFGHDRFSVDADFRDDGEAGCWKLRVVFDNGSPNIETSAFVVKDRNGRGVDDSKSGSDKNKNDKKDKR